MPLAPRKGKPGRRYDRVVAITRSGSTSEVLTDLGTRRSAITGVGDDVVLSFVDNSLLLIFADEQSVVQTRLITALLILARHAYAYGYDVDPSRRGYDLAAGVLTPAGTLSPRRERAYPPPRG